MRKFFVLFALVLFSVVSQAQTTKHSVALSWTPAATTGVTLTDFNIYRSTTSGTGYVAIGHTGSGTITSFTDVSVTAGTTYYYVVTSLAGTEESADSNEAKATIPFAPAPPTGLTAIVK